MEDQKVCILLAAYNGEKYIRQMIDSVLLQDYSNILLVLSDDGSQDGTQKILTEYAEMEPDRVIHYRSGQRFGSAQYHFLHLLSKFHDAPYIMFCDQDDVWHKDKVRKTLEKMRQVENGDMIPAMVHTDLRVVDENLEQISTSFWKYSNLDGTRLALNQLLVQNVVTGCTMMINRALAERVCNAFPKDGMLMHDWWIALLASATGRAGAVSEATVDYRQHGSNSVGAKDVQSASYLWHRLTSSSMRNGLKAAATQAEAFLECYGDCMTAPQKELIRAFVAATNKPLLIKNVIYVRYGLVKFGITRKIAQFLGL